jgi:hypothetical protein
VLVFAGSNDVLPLIDGTGALSIYHEASFAYVSKEANYEYLDNVFVDMVSYCIAFCVTNIFIFYLLPVQMWFKSFSVWLLLKLGYNILFQDVDLVWFRDPLKLFDQYKLTNGLLSDRKDRLPIWSNDDSKYIPQIMKQHTENNPFRRPVDAYLSDDGQRSLRYTPFYANSGFYFLFSNDRTIYFTWTM